MVGALLTTAQQRTTAQFFYIIARNTTTAHYSADFAKKLVISYHRTTAHSGPQRSGPIEVLSGI